MKQLTLLLLALIYMIGAADAQTITVTSGPDTIASGVNVSGDTTVCDGSSISFTVALDVGIDNVNWVANPAGTFTPSNTNITVTVTPTVNTSYLVYVYGPGPANYVGYVQINVVVASLPSAQTVTANGNVGKDGAYCPVDAGTVFGLQGSEVGSTYQLQIDMTSTDVGAPVAGPGTAINFAPAPAGNDYQILVTNLSGCTTIIR